VKCMESVWQTTPRSTASTNWANVPGFSDHPIAIYPIAIELDQVAATHSNFLRLQWQSPGGAAVQLRRGAMSVLYTTDACQGSS
jgi:hypothetical protein